MTGGGAVSTFSCGGGGITATFCEAIISRCTLIINDDLLTVSCTEWYVRRRELNIAYYHLS